MQARCHGGHFGAVTPKRELWPPKRARIVSPQKKATGPTPLGCICDQDLFALFLVFTLECEGKIRTKGGFCVPQRECVPPKKATGQTPLGAFVIKTFLFCFLSSPPNVRAKSVPKEVFVPPSKNRAPKESIRTDAPGCIFKEDFCSFFWSFPQM